MSRLLFVLENGDPKVPSGVHGNAPLLLLPVRCAYLTCVAPQSWICMEVLSLSLSLSLSALLLLHILVACMLLPNQKSLEWGLVTGLVALRVFTSLFWRLLTPCK